MPFKEYIYSVLIVSSSETFNTSFTALLPQKDYAPVDIVQSINHARRKTAERAYDLVIINTPLPDDFGRKFAIDICENRHTVAVLFVKNDIYDETYARVLEHGVLTLRKPTSASIINQALDWMRAISKRLGKLEKKTLTLEEKMSEIRIVNRAKWALIESCNMTETDAHRYIEKQAMDRCLTKGEIAEGILQTYKS
ncbi:MAG: ANTAR domain-containing protein [Lachnospiraceae bacterium]|nr:ANTAR domain-containing protein [Lachnospiraceae bacterium]